MNGCIYDFNFPLTLRSTDEHAKHLNLYTKRVIDKFKKQPENRSYTFNLETSDVSAKFCMKEIKITEKHGEDGD